MQRQEEIEPTDEADPNDQRAVRCRGVRPAILRARVPISAATAKQAPQRFEGTATHGGPQSYHNHGGRSQDEAKEGAGSRAGTEARSVPPATGMMKEEARGRGGSGAGFPGNGEAVPRNGPGVPGNGTAVLGNGAEDPRETAR